MDVNLSNKTGSMPFRNCLRVRVDKIFQILITMSITRMGERKREGEERERERERWCKRNFL
jgi:hypothetical protein